MSNNKKNNIISTENLQLIREFKAMGVILPGDIFEETPKELFEMSNRELAREVLYAKREDDQQWFLSVHDAVMDRTESPSDDAAFGLLLEEVAREEIDGLDTYEDVLLWVFEYSGPGKPGWDAFWWARLSFQRKGHTPWNDTPGAEAVSEAEKEFFEAFGPAWLKDLID